MKNKFYITTPIYYVNAQPHLGHTYTTIAADVLARYHRLIGESAFFLTGTDEHGAKIAEKAAEAGLEPQQFTDQVAEKFQHAWKELNISNDRFIRTTEPAHEQAVQKAMEAMYAKGDIYKSKYEGLYCVGCEQFKNEKDLVDGLCPDHKVAPVWMSEEAYMFKLSKYQDQLLEKIKQDELMIRPVEKKNEMISFFEQQGLKDVAFSREKVKWGIPVPWDESQTIYVWADAFLNYLTGLGWQGEAGSWPEFWPAEVQLIAKDILRVHSTIWPAMLLSLDIPVQKQLFVHGFFLSDGQKMSKSLGNVIAPEDLVKKYGIDGTRYLLMAATTFGNDGDITWKFLDEKYNADLANGLGNLVARSITLVEKLREAGMRLEETENGFTDNWSGNDFDHSIDKIWQTYQERFAKLEIDKVLELANQQQRFLDNYITTTKPWELIKNADERAGQVLYNILERLRHISLMLKPFMPAIADTIQKSLGVAEMEFTVAIRWGGLMVDAEINKPEALFPRI